MVVQLHAFVQSHSTLSFSEKVTLDEGQSNMVSFYVDFKQQANDFHSADVDDISALIQTRLIHLPWFVRKFPL